MARCSWHFPLSFCCIALSLVLAAGPATGAVCEARTTGIDTLVVRARPLAASLPISAAVVTTRIDLEGSNLADDLADVLGQVAGLQVRRYGGLGAAAVPSLRGSSAAQLRVFIAGVPVADAQSGSADLARLPMDRFAAVEIHRGMVPLGLGGIGGAGAVNLIPRTEARGWDLGASVGSFGREAGRLIWGDAGAAQSRSILLMVHGARCDNDFTFTDHLQTFYDTTDDTLSVRRNADYREWGGWASGHWESGPLRAGVGVGHFHQDGGRPGPLGDLSPHARIRYDRSDVDLTGDLHEGLISLQLAAGRDEEFLFDPLAEVGMFTMPDTTRSLSQDVSGRIGWNPQLARRSSGWLGGLDLQLGCEQRRQWYRQWLQDQPDPLRGRITTAAHAAGVFYFFGDRFQVMPSWRWQRAEDDFPPVPSFYLMAEEENVRHVEDSVSPGFGLVFAAVPGRLFLTAHATRTVRIPTWIELFGHRGGVQGNRNLLAEDLTQADLAVHWQAPEQKLSVRAAVFHAETDRTIIYVQNSVHTSTPLNFGLTRTQGLELELAARLPTGFRLAGNLTVQAARDRGDDPTYRGKHLPFLPDREAWLQLSRPLADWQPSLELVLESANFRDRYNTELDQAPARTLLTVGLARSWQSSWPRAAGSLTLAGEVVNVTDNKIYDVEGYPLPGRTWQLGIRWQI